MPPITAWAHNLPTNSEHCVLCTTQRCLCVCVCVCLLFVCLLCVCLCVCVCCVCGWSRYVVCFYFCSCVSFVLKSPPPCSHRRTYTHAHARSHTHTHTRTHTLSHAYMHTSHSLAALKQDCCCSCVWPDVHLCVVAMWWSVFCVCICVCVCVCVSACVCVCVCDSVFVCLCV